MEKVRIRIYTRGKPPPSPHPPCVAGHSTSDTHHTNLMDFCAHSCCRRRRRAAQMGLNQPSGQAGRAPAAPPGAAASAWNFPPMGRPAEPRPIGGARWRRRVGAEVRTASQQCAVGSSEVLTDRVGGVRRGGRSGVADPQPLRAAARPGDGEGEGRGLPFAQTPSPSSSLTPDPRPLFPLPGPI